MKKLSVLSMPIVNGWGLILLLEILTLDYFNLFPLPTYLVIAFYIASLMSGDCAKKWEDKD